MSLVLIAIVDDDPCAMRRKGSCDLWATTHPRLPQPTNFSNPSKSKIQLPGLSGIDLQEHLVARGHCIPIIFMTGYPSDSVRARAMKAGAVCFLNKPFREDHFIGCIERALKAA